MIITRSNSELDVFAATIYAEARGEPEKGQTAVAYVIINRAVLNQRYWGGNSVKRVCLEPRQFECWNGGSININDPGTYRAIKENAQKILREVQETIRTNPRFPFENDPTEGCDHYNNPRKENADWVNNVRRWGSIGNHVFYQSNVTETFQRNNNQNIYIDFE